MGGEAGRAPSGGLRSCACSRTGWGRHHHHHHDGDRDDVDRDDGDRDDGDMDDGERQAEAHCGDPHSHM